MMNYKHYLVCVLALALSGCSMFSPVKPDTPSTYFLNALPQTKIEVSRPYTLLVNMPDSAPAYNTTQMAYTTQPYKIAYFSQNQWAETPSQMLAPLLVQTMQNTHAFRALVSAPYVGRYDYVLNTQILTLEQDFTRTPAAAVFTLRVQLNKMSTNTIIATKLFTVVVPIKKRNPYSGVIAANIATSKMLNEIALFTIRNIN